MTGQASTSDGGVLGMSLDGTVDAIPAVVEKVRPVLHNAVLSADPLASLVKELSVAGNWTMLGDSRMAQAAMSGHEQSTIYRSGATFVGTAVYWPEQPLRDIGLIGLDYPADNIATIDGQTVIHHLGAIGAGGTSVVALDHSGLVVRVGGEINSNAEELVKLAGRLVVTPLGEFSSGPPDPTA
jgi:hypothetical protein